MSIDRKRNKDLIGSLIRMQYRISKGIILLDVSSSKVGLVCNFLFDDIMFVAGGEEWRRKEVFVRVYFIHNLIT